MNQLSDNVIVIGSGEQIPPNTEDWLKIYLAGSEDISGDPKKDWQTVFANGLVSLTNGPKALIMFKNIKYLLINPKAAPQNPQVALENPEFVQKLNWRFDMMAQADAVFLNFLARTQNQTPFMEFGYLLTSQKLVVRSSDKYMNYPYVKGLCEKMQIPFHGSNTGYVSNIVQSMYSFIPRFQEITQLRLPE